MSALHTATSHFYHDSYFRRFPFGLYTDIAVGNYKFVVCNIFVLIRHLVAGSHCCDSCACMHRSCSDCNTLTLSLPRSSIDDLVFSVFPSNFFKLSYKISLRKNRFVTLFFIRFSYNFQNITLISSRIG